jgi:hypothetical protein
LERTACYPSISKTKRNLRTCLLGQCEEAVCGRLVEEMNFLHGREKCSVNPSPSEITLVAAGSPISEE